MTEDDGVTRRCAVRRRGERVYRTYFTGPLPGRAFLGAGSLLGGAHFEVMGVAVRSKK